MKSLLKKILPPLWVGQLANALNKLNRLIVVPLVFREYPLEKIKFLRNTDVRPVELIFPDAQNHYNHLPIKIADAFRDFNDQTQKEFVAQVDDCLIEPRYGWPMTARRELIYDCFHYSRQHIVPTPSIFSTRNKKVKAVDAVISFRDVFEFGYWHFYSDIIHKNYLLKDFPQIGPEIPILISRQVFDGAPFRFIYEQTRAFAGREIIVQDDYLIKARRAYFIKPRQHQPAYYRATADLVNDWKGGQTQNRRVFLTRGKARGRFIHNLEALMPSLDKYGFELIDADNLSVSQQIKVFSETRFLIGIHGAGLTNMMFRHPGTLRVLEILPYAEGRFQIPPHYFLLAGIFGFHYQALLGDPYVDSVTKSFRVDTSGFDSAVQALVDG